MSKSSITFRRCKNHIQVYRTSYGNCHQRIFLLENNLSNADELSSLLLNETEKNRWEKWLASYFNNLHAQRIQAILERGPVQSMIDIADALAHLAQNDPKGADPNNHEIGINIWPAWQKVWAVIGSKSGWRVEQKYALDTLRSRSSEGPPE